MHRKMLNVAGWSCCWGLDAVFLPLGDGRGGEFPRFALPVAYSTEICQRTPAAFI